jgi:cyclase
MTKLPHAEFPMRRNRGVGGDALTVARRIIPCLDVKDGRVVKGVRFRGLRDAGDPAELAEYYYREGADEIVFLDISASPEGRRLMVDVVRRTAESVFIPMTVGGGISELEHFREALAAGADKVSVNTAAVENPELVSEAADVFGSQCVVVAIDAKREPLTDENEHLADHVFRDGDREYWFRVYVRGGREPTDLDAISWAKRVEELGAGEILLTSIDADGTKEGYDLELTRAVCRAVNVPVIASGGCGHPRHMLEVFEEAGADAALAASIFHYGEYSIREVKEFLARRGVHVRPC